MVALYRASPPTMNRSRAMKVADATSISSKLSPVKKFPIYLLDTWNQRIRQILGTVIGSLPPQTSNALCHQSHFELEAADNKSHPLETTVAKENLDKIQIEVKTKNLSYC